MSGTTMVKTRVRAKWLVGLNGARAVTKNGACANVQSQYQYGTGPRRGPHYIWWIILPDRSAGQSQPQGDCRSMEQAIMEADAKLIELGLLPA